MDVWDDFMSNLEGVFPVEGTRDRVIWAPSSSGRFSCRSFRRLIARLGPISDKWKSLWDMPILLKVKYFMWLLVRDMVAVRVDYIIWELCRKREMFVLFVVRVMKRVDTFSCTVIGFTRCGLGWWGFGIWTLLRLKIWPLTLMFGSMRWPEGLKKLYDKWRFQHYYGIFGDFGIGLFFNRKLSMKMRALNCAVLIFHGG